MAATPLPAAAEDARSIARGARRVVAVTNPTAAKGSITWEVKKFSALSRSLKIGERFASPDFMTGTKKWSLHIYPQGRRDTWKDHIGIFLHYESDEAVVINFSISIIPCVLMHTVAGSLCSSNLRMEGHFKTGWDDFIGRAELPEFLSKDDTLTVECDVECLSEWKASVVPDLQLQSSDTTNCATDVGSLLKMSPEESFADFEFDVGGHVFHTHKAILAARSPVFRSMLSTNMRESRAGRVQLHDVEKTVFSALLTYVYSGAIDEEFLATKCEEVLALADKFDIRKLKERCEVLLSKAITLETVVNLLGASETYHAASLKSVALQFAAQHFMELIHNDDYKELGLRSPVLILEVQEQFATQNGAGRKRTIAGAVGDEEPKRKQQCQPAKNV